MMNRRLALIVGNSEYDDSTLSKLKTPNADVIALAEALRNPEIGNFDEVATFANASEGTVRRAISTFFTQKKSDDLLLMYFSGHGILDDWGRLFLAVKDTQRYLLKATGIAATFINEEMDTCRAKRKILILDCCNSGAFARGSKGETKAVTRATFEGVGYGHVVLTASDSTQYAFEGDRVIKQAELSLFTHYLVEGLTTGRADRDQDGRITLDEWYDYTYDQIVSQTPSQTPSKWSYKQQGELVIAQNPWRQVFKPSATPRSDVKYGTISTKVNINYGAVKSKVLLFIDDKEVGAAWTYANDSIDVVVNPGQHTVFAAWSWQKSNRLSVFIRGEETVNLLCEMNPGILINGLILKRIE